MTAIEPVRPLRRVVRARHRSSLLDWLDDQVPDLARVPNRQTFELIVVNGVWQYLNAGQQRRAMRRLGELAARGGMTFVSLLHGPGAASRPVHAIDVGETLGESAAGFEVVRRQRAESLQDANRAAGVYWTWLALRRT